MNALIAARHWLESVNPRGDGWQQVRQEGLRHCEVGLCRHADKHQGNQGGYLPSLPELIDRPRAEFLTLVRSATTGSTGYPRLDPLERKERGYVLGLVVMSWARSGDLYCAAKGLVAANSLGLWNASVLRSTEYLLDQQDSAGFFQAGLSAERWPCGDPEESGLKQATLLVTVATVEAISLFAAADF